MSPALQDLGLVGSQESYARHASPPSLNLWITLRTVSSSPWARLATTGAVPPPAEANNLTARRNLTVTDLVLPRRTITGPPCSAAREPGPAAPSRLPTLIGEVISNG